MPKKRGKTADQIGWERYLTTANGYYKLDADLVPIFGGQDKLVNDVLRNLIEIQRLVRAARKKRPQGNANRRKFGAAHK